ncbi:hypothetical protein O5D80_008468 [Batrachochytrium dendrobatidis]|nr:hypothetical protein O5D80_008468 [Batrachochytrium dendrobatidis]
MFGFSKFPNNSTMTKWNYSCASASINQDIVDPPGFVPASESARLSKKHRTSDDENMELTIANLKVKKAWDTALAPAKSIPMNALMLYMSGNSIQIFSILITVMLLFNSAKSMMCVSQAFERFQTVTSTAKLTGFAAWKAFLLNPLLLPMTAFFLIQAGNLALGVWKCGAMGLLPTATSDWLAFLENKEVIEKTIAGWI